MSAVDREDVRVTREPLTYERSAPRSYFRDLALAHNDNGDARIRLERHEDEMRVEVAERERRAWTRARDQGIELRVNPNRTDGQGGYFSPPLWLIDEFATAPRPSRVLSALAPTFPLPAGISQVNLPRLTTGTQTQGQNDLEAESDRDLIDAQVSSTVVTITGQGDVALQLLEQSPPGAHLDWAIFKDLTADYDAQMEMQLLVGSGAGQLTGLLGMSGANAVTYTSATPTGSAIFAYLGNMAAQIGDARLMPPEVWLMRTARWSWLGTAEDTTGQPLAVPGHVPVMPMPYLFDDNRPAPVAHLLGWPIYCDDAIPANFGTGANQDIVLACRPSDMILLESVPRTAVMLEVLSGTLQARLQLHAYVASLTGRYPSGVATLAGSGLVVQTGE
jgi:HK97 family phage major capsid protein